MLDLERAIEIAAAAHRGQTDRAGAQYILHPLRVMLACEGDSARIVGVLHDVVEDTTWTLEALRDEGASDEILASLESVTRRADESYEEFIDRAACNPVGRVVKIADLKDNLDITRIAAPNGRDKSRQEKYRAALDRLESATAS
ncbi:GTP pyrophosphokinase [Tropicimonas sp. IMCC6043]|uniref:GTP pyrophosphokinase n=1 Tax=Tropicimonas sp. IMCC6043 TaxID=2510645 RepID=UPI00101CB577|nr:GTP pyrophosphokinase [Tropicimonas sp. IMCC6043]RYH08293.1 GTP pyrophosphokinase [Tropicimonas sp. IMCC6043]